MYATQSIVQDGQTKINSHSSELQTFSKSKTDNIDQVSQASLNNQKPAKSAKKMSESHVSRSNKKSNKKSTSFFDSLFNKPKPIKYGKNYREGDRVIIEGKVCTLTLG